MASQTQDDIQTFSIVALWVETVFYGVYAVLFSASTYILCARKKPGRALFLATTIIMFGLATASVVLSLGACLPHGFGADAPTWILYVTNNILADGLVVYRCYVVWGKNKIVIILPIILLIATTALGFIVNLRLLLILSLVTNISISSLTAGRIWWISRHARAILSTDITKIYMTVIVIILESGAIYSISLIISLAVFAFIGPATIMLGALSQIVGIVPTLIVVRVGLDLSADGSEKTTEPVFRPGTNTSAMPSSDVELGVVHIVNDRI